MISVETTTIPPSDEALTMTMVTFRDEHNRSLGNVMFNQFSDRPLAIVTFRPGDDVSNARAEENFGGKSGAFVVFLTPDESKLLPMRSDIPTELPENVRRLFPHPDDLGDG